MAARLLSVGLLAISITGALALTPPAAYAAAESDAADERAKAALVAALAFDDLYRIEAGQIAFRKATTPELKAQAQQAVEAAKASYQALENPALAAGVPLPTSVDQQRRQWLIALRAASPKDFEKLFVQQQLVGAKQALDLAEAYLQSGQGFYLKEYVGREAPRLRELIAQVSAKAPPAH